MSKTRKPRNLIWKVGRRTRRTAYQIMSALSAIALIVRFIDSASAVAVYIQTFIWIVFAVYTCGYVHVVHPGPRWWRHHVADVLVVLMWNPYLLSHTMATRNFLDAFFQLVGWIAHLLIASRCLRFRFGQHILLSSLLGLIIVSLLAAALLHRIEPQTFPNFWSGVWFCFETITTLGYGDFVPHTVPGQVVSAVMHVCGAGVWGALPAFLGTRIQQSIYWNPKRRRPSSRVSEPENSELLALIKALSIQVSVLQTSVDKLKAGDAPASSTAAAPGNDTSSSENTNP